MEVLGPVISIRRKVILAETGLCSGREPWERCFGGMTVHFWRQKKKKKTSKVRSCVHGKNNCPSLHIWFSERKFESTHDKSRHRCHIHVKEKFRALTLIQHLGTVDANTNISFSRYERFEIEFGETNFWIHLIFLTVPNPYGFLLPHLHNLVTILT